MKAILFPILLVVSTGCLTRQAWQGASESTVRFDGVVGTLNTAGRPVAIVAAYGHGGDRQGVCFPINGSGQPIRRLTTADTLIRADWPMNHAAVERGGLVEIHYRADADGIITPVPSPGCDPQGHLLLYPPGTAVLVVPPEQPIDPGRRFIKQAGAIAVMPALAVADVGIGVFWTCIFPPWYIFEVVRQHRGFILI